MRLKLRQIGNSFGVLLPMEIVNLYKEVGFVNLVVLEDEKIYDFVIQRKHREVVLKDVVTETYETSQGEFERMASKAKETDDAKTSPVA